MSIQEDILDTIGASGIGVKALRERMSNIGGIELDVAVRALQRAKRITVVNERYEVAPSTRSLGAMPHTGRPPSAEEEAAASLFQPVTRVCITCQGPPQPLHRFRFIGPGNERARECNACHGKKTQAGQVKKRGKRSEYAGSNPACRADDSKAGVVAGTEGMHPSSATNGSVQPQVHDGSVTTTSVSAAAPARVSSGNGSVAPIVFHSARRETNHCDIAQSVERLAVNEDVPGSSPGVAASSGASTQPTVSSDVLERVKAHRQMSLNKIALLEVQVANERSRLKECDEFLRLYERFAQGAA